jgi:hypothetical protein
MKNKIVTIVLILSSFFLAIFAISSMLMEHYFKPDIHEYIQRMREESPEYFK